MTLTSIGYGDILPISTAERALCCLYMIISALSWTYVIGTAAGIAATLDPNKVMYQQTMDHLNFFMRERRLPKEMRITLRDYFTSARGVHQVTGDKDLLDKMSPLLQGTVAVRANKLWLDQIWFLRGINKTREEREFVAELSKKLTLSAYIVNERMPIGQLYILRKGMVVRLWRFLSANSVWGEDMLLENLDLVCHAQAVALNYVEVYTLTRNMFTEVAEKFHGPMQKVSKMMRKVTLQRAILSYLSNHMGRRNIRSFIGRRAAAGYAYAPPSQTQDQKLDKMLTMQSQFSNQAQPLSFQSAKLALPDLPPDAVDGAFAALSVGLSQKQAAAGAVPPSPMPEQGAAPQTPTKAADAVPPSPMPSDIGPVGTPGAKVVASIPSRTRGAASSPEAVATMALVHHCYAMQKQLLESHNQMAIRMEEMSAAMAAIQAQLAPPARSKRGIPPPPPTPKGEPSQILPAAAAPAPACSAAAGTRAPASLSPAAAPATASMPPHLTGEKTLLA